MEWHRNALKSYKWWLDWPGSNLERFLSKREVDLNTLPNGLIDKTLCKDTTVSMRAYIYKRFGISIVWFGITTD